jgi:hypothetical protein
MSSSTVLSHVDVASGKTEEVIVGPVKENGKDLTSGKNLGNYADTKGRMDVLQFYKDHKKDLPNLWIIVQWEAVRHVCVCCVNSTSGGRRSLATPAYQGRLALVSLPLGAAVNKIKSATLTLPSAQGRPLARLHPTFPRNCCSTGAQSHTKLQSLSSSSMIAGPAGPCTGRSKPLSFAKSKSIG